MKLFKEWVPLVLVVAGVGLLVAMGGGWPA